MPSNWTASEPCSAVSWASYDSLKGARLLDTLPSPEGVGYRNRARMAVGLSRHGGATLGYFRAGTREIVDAPECGVLVPELLETTRRDPQPADHERATSRASCATWTCAAAATRGGST